MGKNGAGTYTDTLVFGGLEPAYSAKTEKWNGTIWYEQSDLSNSRQALAGAGASSTAALASFGDAPGQSADAELWSGTSNTTKTIDTD